MRRQTPSKRDPDPRVERREGIVTYCKPMPPNRPLVLRHVGLQAALGRGKVSK